MSRSVLLALRAGHALPGWRPGERREVEATEAPALLAAHPELVAVPLPLAEPAPILTR